MSALPRGLCSVCLASVPIRVTGDAREHERSTWTKWSTREKCPGSGKPVIKK